MISEDFIKKIAREELGAEGTDWFYSAEKGYGQWIRKVEVRCEHCGTCFHRLFDLRETTDENSEVNLGVRARIKQLRNNLHGII